MEGQIIITKKKKKDLLVLNLKDIIVNAYIKEKLMIQSTLSHYLYFIFSYKYNCIIFF